MIPLFFTLSYFNSHAHMERDQAGNVRRNAVLHFNSHAHVERDKYLFTHVNDIFISTHTLTWSVTRTISKTLTNAVISTHTLTWSVTGILRQQRSNWKFQLTRSRGA